MKRLVLAGDGGLIPDSTQRLLVTDTAAGNLSYGDTTADWEGSETFR